MRLERTIGLLAIGLLASCAPPEGDTGTQDPNSQAVSSAPEPEGEPAPDNFYDSAWRVVAADGARYVTYLDAGGTYRDLRNGDPWQEGTWSHDEGPEGKVLCFVPDDEDGVERCWIPGRVTDGTMVATNAAGRRIELERVDYVLPSADEDDEGA